MKGSDLRKIFPMQFRKHQYEYEHECGHTILKLKRQALIVGFIDTFSACLL